MRLALRIAALVLPTVLSTGTFAQTTLSQDIVGSTRPLSSDQESQVQSFASDQMTDLAKGDPVTVVDARNTLVQTARRAGVTGVFLGSFSDAIMPEAKVILADAGPMRAENTLRVLAFLRTPDALGVLVDSTNPRSVTDAGRRLVAAGLLEVALGGNGQTGLDSGVLTSAARSIAENLANESNWIVALEDLRALNTIALDPALTKENRTEVRGVQFGAFQNLAVRIEGSSGPDELVQAVYRAMLGLRGKLLDDTTAGDIENKEIARILRIVLKDVADAAIKQWDGLASDRRAYVAYEGVLRVGAQLLSLLEGRPDSKADALRDGIEQGKSALADAVKNFGG